jgi:DNA polymerase sigma
MECDYSKLENNFVEYILNLIGPNIELDKSREIKFHALKNIISKAFFIDQTIIPHFFCYGSYPLQTYLPDSDMDVTIILEDKNTHTIITNYSYEFLNKYRKFI